MEAEGVATYLHEDRPYAYLVAGGETIPCAASGGAGEILVRCSSEEEGLLIVQENSWDGWHAWADGEPVTMRSSPGTHEYRFRYLPWDVPLGSSLTVLGCAATITLYARADEKTQRQTTAPSPPGR